MIPILISKRMKGINSILIKSEILLKNNKTEEKKANTKSTIIYKAHT